MKFMLYPRAPKMVAETLRKSRPAGRTMGPSAAEHSHRSSWGQQCSENCGCVVRFESQIVDSRIKSLSYDAKQLVVNERNGNLVPTLTSKGRPMVRECQCPTVHHLSGIIVHELENKTIGQAKNELEFTGPRSSDAFQQTALAVQDLPATSSSCFDLVEEAITAMVKGHLPRPRRQPLQQKSPQLADLKYTQHWHHATDLNFYSQPWRLDDDEAARQNPLSTLNLFKEDSGVETPASSDWVAYVDEQHEAGGTA